MIALYPFCMLIPSPENVQYMARGLRYLNPFRSYSTSSKSTFAGVARRTSHAPLHAPVNAATEPKQASNRFTSAALAPASRLYSDFQSWKRLRKTDDQIKKSLETHGMDSNHSIEEYRAHYIKLNSKFSASGNIILIPTYRRVLCAINAKTAVRAAGKSFNANHIHTNAASQAKLIAGMMPNPAEPDNMSAFITLCEEQNIGLIIDLTQEHEHGSYRSYFENTGSGIELLCAPTPDHAPIPHKILKALAIKINETLSQGKNIYVHCKGGNGRTGQVCAAALMPGILAEKQASGLSINAFELASLAVKEVRKMRRDDMVNLVSYIGLVEYAKALLEQKSEAVIPQVLETLEPAPLPEYQTMVEEATNNAFPKDSLEFIIAEHCANHGGEFITAVNQVLWTSIIRALLAQPSLPVGQNLSPTISQDIH